jgi:hypothetical protein
MVQRVTPAETHANGLSDTTTPFVGTTPDHSMKFKVDEITDIVVNNVTTAEVVAKDTNGKAILLSELGNILTVDHP